MNVQIGDRVFFVQKDLIGQLEILQGLTELPELRESFSTMNKAGYGDCDTVKIPGGAPEAEAFDDVLDVLTTDPADYVLPPGSRGDRVKEALGFWGWKGASCAASIASLRSARELRGEIFDLRKALARSAITISTVIHNNLPTWVVHVAENAVPARLRDVFAHGLLPDPAQVTDADAWKACNSLWLGRRRLETPSPTENNTVLIVPDEPMATHMHSSLVAVAKAMQ